MVSNSKKTQNSAIVALLNSVWGVIIGAITLFGFGFSAGFYVSNIDKKIEIAELNRKNYERLTELNQQKNLLELENEKLKNK